MTDTDDRLDRLIGEVEDLKVDVAVMEREARARIAGAKLADEIGPWRNPRDTWGHYDRIGRRQPRAAFTHSFLLAAIPGALERLRRVPAGAVVEVGTDTFGPYAFIACPCTARPIAHEGELAKCSGCERYYIAEDQDVFVFYGAMAPPPLPG